ncbi:hypothetical protein CI109_107402 [Kwoniella shandongensis]|uniref:Uncharacterized protein n=1 Tax=Kwoniella shandongensis TaxID=1734106 RepID=A0A5M6BVM0_9TREE|nr:uncharacterized protein CI109_004670 [Kwoniella shandongensis]KAA5526894.1 hypothetical protein CI109_004670 [Kwoniella shandongensis]
MSSSSNNPGYPPAQSQPQYYPASNSYYPDPNQDTVNQQPTQSRPGYATSPYGYPDPQLNGQGVSVQNYGGTDRTGGRSSIPPGGQQQPFYHQQGQPPPFDPSQQYAYTQSPQQHQQQQYAYQSTPKQESHYIPSPQQNAYPQASHFSPYQQHLPSQVLLSPGPAGSPSLSVQSSGSHFARPSQPSGAIDPSLVWQTSNIPSTRSQPPPQPPVDSIPSETTTPNKPSIRIKIRAPAATATPSPSAPATMVKPTRHAQPVVKQEVEVSTSGRPQRGASQRAQTQLKEYHDDYEDDEFDDDEGQDAEGEDDDDGDFGPPAVPHTTRSGRGHKPPVISADDFENKLMPTSPPSPPPQRRSGRKTRQSFIDPDEDEDEEDSRPPPRNAFPTTRATRNSIGSASVPAAPDAGPSYTNGNAKSTSRRSGRGRPPSKARHSSADAEEFEPTEEESASDRISSDPLGNYEDEEDEHDDLESVSSGSPRKGRKLPARSQVRSMPTRRQTRAATKQAHDSDDDDYGGAAAAAKRNLRTRTSRPNYQLPTLEDLSKEISMADAIAAVSRPNGRANGARGLGASVRFGAGAAAGGLPWSMKGNNLPQAMGDPDSSDSDDFAAPLKSGAAGPSMSSTAPVGRAGMGGPSDVPNFGRINPKSSMADADPLGVDMNVTFDNVGGLDDHINQLKEMVALPLLYPELFQQFGITPPRGVLFHGPPGTGKTLLARALAASCSTGNTKISFFMRKGADVLSKWVGEAERQLRMLFEEARASQPSIIFFDEIDGLAPVRSSKQDQIHASLVSTLLALMDGMDGRGQVIVIGATNRPDAVDAALRRPGRFDREFYFPLPNRTARKKIIGINTRKWEPKLSDEFLDKLAVLTKGYGGADLRALCTEAALNAIQRRYPQIYKTPDRLQLEAASIHVQAKDFMMSIKKIVPSSARSTSSAAIQLPPHLVPLLSAPLNRLQTAIDHVLPPKKHRTALEEAEYEDEDGDSFEKHMMLQSLDKLRTFRPRILVHGQPGLGQTFLGPAVLHHLEGFHVQSFDLGTLMGDSNRSVEAAIVQLFVEAKRHQPSVIFIPTLSEWSETISHTARSTVRALLDGIPPSDPILLLGMADGPLDELPSDVRDWFGFAPENKIELALPTLPERSAYFADLVEAVKRPPTEFPDGVPRRKRVLEILPLAAPLPPRLPTEAELAREEEKDQAARNMMILSFTSLVQEFMKRYRKVATTVKEDAMLVSQYLAEQAATAAVAPPQPEIPAASVASEAMPQTNGDVTMDVDPTAGPVETPVTDKTTPIVPPVSAPVIEAQAPVDASASASAPAPTWQAHPIDIDTLQRKLVRHKYFTPAEFLADVAKIEENAEKIGDPDRQAKIADMAANARIHVSGFDPKWTPEFERYAVRMRQRKADRQKRKEAAMNGNEEVAKEKENEQAEVQPSTGNDNVASAEGINGLKRAREEGETEEDNQGREKRSREDGGSEGLATATNNDGTSLVEGGQSEFVTPLSTQSQQVIVPSEPEPEVVVAHPPFVLPQESIDLLKADLDIQTRELTVDQLEQLRASLFDMIWRHRGEWDRREVVNGMRDRLGDYVREVEKWRGAE